VRGRFAPSPTGRLHRGNLRTALLAWLDARLAGGELLLRLDDLDTPRNRPGAEESILADLRWLGLDWDGPPLRQSERRGLYATALSALRRGGALYPCRCSRRLLADVSAPHGALSVYPGYCRALLPQWGAVGGRLPSWRLRLPAGPLRWPERFAAPGRLEGATAVGDGVLRRADGVVAYHLATAVDELTLGISDVVRGEDLADNTARQILLQRQLGLPTPRYLHTPLVRNAQGEKLSKQTGAPALDTRAPLAALNAAAAMLGLLPMAGSLPEALASWVAQWRALWLISVDAG